MDEKVSVIVSCYNHEEYIEACLRSIFSQTYSNIELLVFNDGSTDHSDAVILSVLRDSPFNETHYFSADNRGLAFVKNDGLAKATGEFFLFVDSDNFLNPDHLEKLLSALTEKDKDIAYGQLWDFIHQKDVLREDLDYDLEKMLQGNLIDASSLLRRSCIQSAKFDEELNNKVLEDYDFWLSLIIENGARPVFVEDTKLNYRVLETSMNDRGNWENYYHSYFYIMNKYKGRIPDRLIQALEGNILLWVKGFTDQEQQMADMGKAIQDKDRHISNLDEQIKILSQELDTLRRTLYFRLRRKIIVLFRKQP